MSPVLLYDARIAAAFAGSAAISSQSSTRAKFGFTEVLAVHADENRHASSAKNLAAAAVTACNAAVTRNQVW